MSNNPLRTIQDYGQSIWLDDLRREMVQSGELQRLIDEDGIRGVTSNPAIFEKAITGSPEYDEDIQALAGQGKSIEDIYQALTVKDVQMAADVFRPLYDQSGGQHGYVSLEVNPHLAHDSGATIAEAHRLWEALARPNVMIKVPATREGLICIEELIGAGINVNVTLLFALPRYRQVVEAYIRGLQARADAGKPLAGIASVASFFLSRIDVLIDPILRKKRREQGPDTDIVKRIYGQVAISCAKQATRIAEKVHGGDELPPCGHKERGRSVCYGPAPAPRKRNSAISNMSRPLLDRIPSTPYRERRSRPIVIMAGPSSAWTGAWMQRCRSWTNWPSLIWSLTN